MSCAHENFEAGCDVTRVLDGREESEGGELVAFALEVEVACSDCGARFGFRGVPCGVSLNGSPARSADALTLRAWLVSPAELVLARMEGPAGVTAP